MTFWGNLNKLLTDELTQCREEGKEVPADFQLQLINEGTNSSKLLQLYDEMRSWPLRSDFPYEEPETLEKIKQARPAAPIHLPQSQDLNIDRFYGAWLGRSVGIALGLPLERSPFTKGTEDVPGWKHIQRWFQGADAYPIQSYVPEQSRALAEYGFDIRRDAFPQLAYRETIRFMPTDDDIRYTILGTVLMEQKGIHFTTADVGNQWLEYLTFGQVFTAEAQAYSNYIQVLQHIMNSTDDLSEADFDWVRNHLNPYREWIGAQIRVDGYAYAAAGNPRLAAELAYRDASFSHVKNGVYAAMFYAAMIAAAFVEQDLHKIVDIGLGEIPANCRLTEAAKLAVKLADSSTSQLELVDRIWQAFNHYHDVHAINNAALVTAALIFSKGDFEAGVTTVVLGGWDTDCNGATVGSILGARNGASQIPSHWKEPLNDTLFANIQGFDPISIQACAERSRQLALNWSAK